MLSWHIESTVETTLGYFSACGVQIMYPLHSNYTNNSVKNTMRQLRRICYNPSALVHIIIKKNDLDGYNREFVITEFSISKVYSKYTSELL